MGFLVLGGCYKDLNKPLLENSGRTLGDVRLVLEGAIEDQLLFNTYTRERIPSDLRALPYLGRPYVAAGDEVGITSLEEIVHEPVVDNAFAGGDGSRKNPYLVEDLLQLRSIYRHRKANYSLTKDIDASPTTQAPFEPLFQNKHLPFVGILDGKGHQVTQLNITSMRGGEAPTGIFGYLGVDLEDPASREKEIFGVVKNLIVVEAAVTANYHTGVIAGVNRGRIVACQVIDSTISIESSVGAEALGPAYGGIVGVSGRYSKLAYSTFSGRIVLVNAGGSTQGGVGGLVGRHMGFLLRCYAKGTIEGVQQVGGLAGIVIGGVAESFSAVDVRGSKRVGGIAGDVGGGVEIVNCYATGRVEGDEKVGGLVGNWNNKGLTNNTSGDITTLRNCYAFNTVTGSRAVGGVIGANQGEEQTVAAMTWRFSKVYWNKEEMPAAYEGNPDGIGSRPFGRTEKQLLCARYSGQNCEEARTFEGWNEEVWSFGDKESTPILVF